MEGTSAAVYPEESGFESTTVAQDKVSNYAEYHLSNWLMLYIAPLILVVGTVCNTISLFVLRHPFFRDSPISFTLSALAVVDTLVLYTSLLRQWILALGFSDIRELFGDTSCKGHFLLTYYLQQLSSWTLVVVTIERTVCVGLPLTAKWLCTRGRVLLLWISIAIALFLLNSHFFVTVSYGRQKPIETENRTEVICYRAEAFKDFFDVYWYFIDFIFLSFLPFVIILIGNIIIIICVVKAIKFRHHQQLSSPTTLTPAISPHNPMTSQTALLVGISFLFLATTSPSAIFFIVSNKYHKSAYPSRRFLAQLRLAFVMTMLLYYVNYALNFVLYCVSGTRFRRALDDICRRKLKGRGETTIRKVQAALTFETRTTTSKRDTVRKLSSEIGGRCVKDAGKTILKN